MDKYIFDEEKPFNSLLTYITVSDIFITVNVVKEA